MSAPVLLLADSQLFFKKDKKDNYLLQEILNKSASHSLSACYIGASNGDDPVFYSLFVEAMANHHIHDCHHITSEFDKQQQEQLLSSDIVLLSGGDVEEGLRVIRKNKIDELLPELYNKGRTLIGVSAGAIQLGWAYRDWQTGRPSTTLQMIPFTIGVHEEQEEWQSLTSTMEHTRDKKDGYGIPYGSGMVYLDPAIEAISKPLTKFTLEKGNFHTSLIEPIRL